MPQLQKPPVFRFAPSPNGHLHIGHAYSALLNEKLARQANGKLLLRIEDIDRQRSKPEFEAGIIDDLNWLGIVFDEAPRRQSDHLPLFQTALDQLSRRGLAYASTISRSQIAALAGTNPDWPRDPDGALLPPEIKPDLQSSTRMHVTPHITPQAAPHAIRLDMKAALAACRADTGWNEAGQPARFDPQRWGDIILKSRDSSFAYHLAVVVDDAAQDITHIVRGRDLYAATAIHRVLQNLLHYAAPDYVHHDLILDASGEKLGKSRNSPTLKSLRQDGMTAFQLRKRLNFNT